MASRYCIPEALMLPFGWEVSVVHLSDAAFDADHGDGTLASWVVEEHTIYLRASRNVKQKRADFAHEMLHVISDWQNAILRSKHTDVKT